MGKNFSQSSHGMAKETEKGSFEGSRAAVLLKSGFSRRGSEVIAFEGNSDLAGGGDSE